MTARRIRPGDETAFAGARPGARIEVRRASGAARIAARTLLDRLGADASAPLQHLASGAPHWPAGIIGSLAHDEAFALAAAARRGRLVGLGVDIEPAEPLPDDVVELVLSQGEQRQTVGDGVARRLVFVAKEAVYKAIHPLDGTPLDFPDIEVRLAWKEATLQGRATAPADPACRRATGRRGAGRGRSRFSAGLAAGGSLFKGLRPRLASGCGAASPACNTYICGNI